MAEIRSIPRDSHRSVRDLGDLFAWIARGVAATFWLAVAGVSLFMMLPVSGPIWRLLPILRELQFPWRFQAVVTLAVAALPALSFAGPHFPKLPLTGLGSIAVL